MSDLRELYQEVIMDHNRSPRNYGSLEDANRTAEGFNPLCGDQLQVYLYVNNDAIIEEVRFEGKGCAISTASASITEPSFSDRVKAPVLPAIAVTSALVRTLTWPSAIWWSQVSRIVSRLPASKSRSLRNTRLLGVAMTCLPFWYLKIVSDR